MVTVSAVDALKPLFNALRVNLGYVRLLIKYYDSNGIYLNEQDIVRVASINIGDKIKVSTQSFTPSIPGEAATFEIVLQIEFAGGFHDGLYLGRFSVDVLKQTEPPLTLNVIIG